MSIINTKLLQYVLTVAEERSMSNAAKRLFISQPSLSQTIKAFEKEQGIEIFDRHTIPLSLTYAGEVFVKYATHILNTEREMEYHLNNISQTYVGKITVGISLFRNSTLMPKILPRFWAKYPNIKVKLIETTNDELIDMVACGKVDLAFVNDNHNSEIDYVELLSDRVLLAIGKENPLSDSYKYEKDYPVIDLGLLHNETFTLINVGSNLRCISNIIFSDNNFTPNTIIETSSIEMAHRMAASNITVSIILQTVLTLFTHEQRANYFRFPKKDYFVKLYICYRKNFPLIKLVNDFITITKQELSILCYPPNSAEGGESED